jgi:hypothetical protein
MSRTKKPSKLCADERAFLDRFHGLNEEETEKLTFEDMIAIGTSCIRSIRDGFVTNLRKRLSTSD